MSVLLALVAAGSWGASDFMGGLAGRRSDVDRTIAVTLVAQTTGLVALALTVPLLTSSAPTGRDLWLGALVGVVGSVAVALLYRGLRRGRMGVVAPIAGATGASLPVVVGAARGDAPSLVAWVGVAIGLTAIVMVSREPRTAGREHDPIAAMRTPGVVEGVLAGAGFGIVFVLLDLTSATSGLWPLITLRMAGIAMMLAAGLTLRQPLRPAPGTGWLLVGVGLLDLSANTAYLLATRQGLLALVALVSSLYPAGTVVLARVVLDEQLARHQAAGLALALAAVSLIAVG